MITIEKNKPVVIAGPTASGKSALALHIAQTQGGVIINADALQVFDGWRIITARPDDTELGKAPHALYGHVPFDAPYSVGHWLRDVTPLLGGARPIIVGGTGLYLTALTQGLADIPPTPAEVRAEADARSLAQNLADLDPKTIARIDINNPVRVQRAWEVLRTTGRSLADWQDNTPPPLLPLADVTALVLDAPKDWLTPRIALRFDQMLAAGALDEAAAMRPTWDPAHLSSKATICKAAKNVVSGAHAGLGNNTDFVHRLVHRFHFFNLNCPLFAAKSPGTLAETCLGARYDGNICATCDFAGNFHFAWLDANRL